MGRYESKYIVVYSDSNVDAIIEWIIDNELRTMNPVCHCHVKSDNKIGVYKSMKKFGIPLIVEYLKDMDYHDTLYCYTANGAFLKKIRDGWYHIQNLGGGINMYGIEEEDW